MNDQTLDPAIHIHELGSNARAAGKGLLTASTEAKNTALTEAAKALRDREHHVLLEHACGSLGAVVGATVAGVDHHQVDLVTQLELARLGAKLQRRNWNPVAPAGQALVLNDLAARVDLQSRRDF